MKKVCFTIGETNLRSGIVKVVVSLVAQLAKEGYEITVLSFREIFDEKNFRNQLPDHVELQSLGISRRAGKSAFFSMIPKVKKFFRRNYYDRIIISGMEFVLPFFLSGIDSGRLIAWEHRNFYAGPFLRMEWLGKRIAGRYFGAVVTITKKDAQIYKQHLHRADIRQIYNVNAVEIEKREYDAQSKKILSVGYLDEVKGFDMLIDAAKMVFEKYPQWRWDIYGEGAKREHLERKISEYGLEKHVCLKGYSSRIRELYSEYALYGMTSRSEGMGMVIVEAQKAGLPVVSFDILCGPSDVIEEGKNGYLIRPFDIKEMAEKINRLIENPKLRKEFSDHSQMKHEELKTEFIVEQWKQLLG